MKLGMLLPHRAVVLASMRRPSLDLCWTTAGLCDRAGMDLWVGDSIVAKPRLEPLTTLSYLAAMTSRARLGTAVLLPALRQPTVLAHALATIDQLCTGRLVLGLGVGWGLPAVRDEWEACGRNHKRRAHDLEEHILVWRKLWSGTPADFAGSDFRLRGHTIGPLPWREEGPPVLITAGNRGQLIPAQVDRVGRLGDGVITTYVTEDDIARLRDACLAAFARHARARASFPLVVYTTVRIDQDAAKAAERTSAFLERYYGGGVSSRGLMGLGPPSAVIDALKRYEAAGVTDLCVRFAGEDQLSQLEQFIEGVLPAFAA